MGRIIGIIPAGGQAVRFKGLDKELLPIAENDCALSRCIRSMFAGGADEVVIIASPEKAGRLTAFVKDYRHVSVHVQAAAGLWAVFVDACNIKADWYYFAMPDTVYPDDAFMINKTAPLMIGSFLTDKPERFGMLRDGQIVDKQKGEPGNAWGVLILNSASMNYLAFKAAWSQNHTTALNALMMNGYKEFPLTFYYDLASWLDYLEFICTLT